MSPEPASVASCLRSRTLVKSFEKSWTAWNLTRLMDELHARLGLCDLAILVRERRFRWFGHVMRFSGEINRVRSRPVPGRKGPGRPKKTSKKSAWSKIWKGVVIWYLSFYQFRYFTDNVIISLLPAIVALNRSSRIYATITCESTKPWASIH